MFTEPWNILQDYHYQIVINLPNKYVTFDQVLSLLGPYVSNNLDFYKRYKTKITKITQTCGELNYIFQTVFFFFFV